MKAKLGLEVNKQVLANCLPLSTPYLFYIFPIYACNFECGYCLNSVDKKRYIYKTNTLDFELYKKRIDECTEFDKKLKLIRFAGMGEPLLHRNIVDMVRYAKEKKVSEGIDIITNGALLTKDMSDALIDASLSKIKISVQGLSAEKYKEIANVDIDFEEYVNNIKYFYKNRKDTKVYIKIIDSALSNKDTKEKFFEIFGDTCDEIAVEHIFPAVQEINYDKFISHNKSKKTVLGFNYKDVEICPQPYYTISLEPDGHIGCCCSCDGEGIQRIPINEDQCMKEIWEGKAFKEFQLKMLDGVHKASDICKKCTTYKYGGIHPKDHLDKDSDRLKKLYNL